jgi:putative colanic acid biosynthesis acetyltransferase WcaF
MCPPHDDFSFIDIMQNRASKKWSRKELIGRALWEIFRGPLFAWTPRRLWGWRRFVLKCFGAQVGREVHIYPSVRIAIPWKLDIEDNSAIGDCANIYNLGRISIGKNVTISQNAHLCAGSHDYRRPDFPLLKPPITILSGAWVCADSFVGPGVIVGESAIVGARAVVMRNVNSHEIAVGNPARVIGHRQKICQTESGPE